WEPSTLTGRRSRPFSSARASSTAAFIQPARPTVARRSAAMEGRRAPPSRPRGSSAAIRSRKAETTRFPEASSITGFRLPNAVRRARSICNLQSAIFRLRNVLDRELLGGHYRSALADGDERVLILAPVIQSRGHGDDPAGGNDGAFLDPDGHAQPVLQRRADGLQDPTDTQERLRSDREVLGTAVDGRSRRVDDADFDRN